MGVMNDTAASRHAAHACLAILGLSLLACGTTTQPDSGAFVDDRPATRAALQQARGRWNSLGISDYQYAFQRSCFCAPDFTAPVRIAVRQGQVAEVTSVQSGQPRPIEGYPTVDDLFARLQEALDSGAENVQATYDPALGYPTRFFIDQSTRIADEEFWAESSGLSTRP
jgi:Family of unknown function (DUF6174)